MFSIPTSFRTCPRLSSYNTSNCWKHIFCTFKWLWKLWLCTSFLLCESLTILRSMGWCRSMSHWTSRICSYLPEAGLRSKHQNKELKVIYIFLWQNHSNIPVTIRRQQTVIPEKTKNSESCFLATSICCSY